MKTVRSEVAKVLAADACSGCGMCVTLDSGLTMHTDAAGFARPRETGAAREVPDAVRTFRRACPGRRVGAQRPRGARRHPLLGSYFGIWEAWAVDRDTRHRGSSGGVLTALQGWLVESGLASEITTAAADQEKPTRTVPVTIMSRDDALAAAGSRYAPVAVAQTVPVAAGGMTAKPCEVAAVRAASVDDSALPVLLSFFCAGTPSQSATDRLVRELGVEDGSHIDEMWYRGRGWPGRFTVRADGREASADYEESWGRVLGPATQWRCKICPDGVGESADIVAADSWQTDERGYPLFAESDGRSALVARTERGLALVQAAEAAGVIELRPLDPGHLVAAQPLQATRRRFLAARLWGARLAGRPVPRFRGFGLMRLVLESPRLAIRTLRGTYRRVRESR
ncbi:Coenzyme F420 hydrogenase/dehydrogenase, beta subunit C-terminal domain [Microbacterium koreense]|uniref:Coenzyme F420 hydrogenase/dehydrogenase, beta subunit C-terminal domain n=1 Tax=Microbacterium koreense TaxID=323761 RepID=A0ABW2ZPR8_9MICO